VSRVERRRESLWWHLQVDLQRRQNALERDARSLDRELLPSVDLDAIVSPIPNKTRLQRRVPRLRSDREPGLELLDPDSGKGSD
jgi:hypothetical protein